MTRAKVAGPIPPRERLTTAEAAAWAGCSASTIKRAKAAGELNPKKRRERGGPDYYLVTELRSWMDGWADA